MAVFDKFFDNAEKVCFAPATVTYDNLTYANGSGVPENPFLLLVSSPRPREPPENHRVRVLGKNSFSDFGPIRHKTWRQRLLVK